MYCIVRGSASQGHRGVGAQGHTSTGTQRHRSTGPRGTAAIPHNTILCYTRISCNCILYSNVLHCMVLYCTVMYCSVLCCTVLYGAQRHRGIEAQRHGRPGRTGAQGHTSTGSEAQEHSSKKALRPYHITLHSTLLEYDAILLYRVILYCTVLYVAE